MSRWDRKKFTRRQLDALKRALGDIAPSKPKKRQVFSKIEMSATGLVVPIPDNMRQTPVQERLRGLTGSDGSELRRDVFYELCELAAEAFPERVDAPSTDLLVNRDAAPLLAYLLGCLRRYRDAYESLRRESGGQILPSDFRSMLEDVFLLKNRPGQHGFRRQQEEEICAAFRRKVDAILPLDWSEHIGDLTVSTIDTARTKGFEAAYEQHYGRSPQLHDDHHAAERIRQVLASEPLWSGLWDSVNTGRQC